MNDWTPEEDEILRQHLPRIGSAGVAAMLVNRKPGGVRARASRLEVRSHRKETKPKSGKPDNFGRCNAVKLRKSAKKAKPGPGLSGDAVITSETRVTICPPFVDRRFEHHGKLPRVVDSAECRDWAKA